MLSYIIMFVIWFVFLLFSDFPNFEIEACWIYLQFIHNNSILSSQFYKKTEYKLILNIEVFMIL